MAAVLGVSGCATDVAYKAPTFGFLSGFNNAPGGVPVAAANDAWWQDFSDPTLNTLFATALSQNLDLEVAREQVTEARATARAVGADIDLTPSASANYSGNTAGAGQLGGSAGLSYLIDPYGLRRQQIKAAGADVDIADARVDAARLTVMYNLATAYVDLRYYQRLLELRRQQLSSRRQSAALTQRLFDRGSATRFDVVRTEALVADTQAQIPTLVAQVRARKNQIAVLTGVAPGQLAVELDNSTAQPRPQLSPEVGIPSDLLRNRPDLRIAERSYYAAVADIGVTEAGLYPRLSLAGTISAVASAGSPLSYSLGPSLSFPALPGEATKARMDASYSRAQQAHTTWKSSVLTALEEVESALASYSGNAASVQETARSARLYREARELTVDLVERDGATIRELISAEENVADSDVALASSLRSMAISYVELNISLGAGSQIAGTE